MSRQRQVLHQEALRAQIMETAKQIIIEEGLNGLSIRKLTSRMDYSPGIIYHYFKDKEALVDAIMLEGYLEILSAIRSVEVPSPPNPPAHIHAVMRKFVEAALNQRVMYRLFLMSDSPEILKRTAVLKKGISETSPSMGMLTEQVAIGMRQGQFKKGDPELTAQVIWASVYGLIMKLIVETEVTESHQHALIDGQLELLIRGLSV